MSELLVMGGASLDVLHVDHRGVRKTHRTIGGAGLYTALAAAKCGSSVTLLAPRCGPAMEQFAGIDSRLNWIGPLCRPDQMPRLEIVHHGNGKATLLAADWGAEAALTVEDLPDNLSQFRRVHIAALSTARKQLDFLTALRFGCESTISVGTYARVAYGETDTVRQLVSLCDAAFMNENEAKAVFEEGERRPQSPERILVVTDGEQGAMLYTAGEIIHINSVPAEEEDPTGAGDTFCGAMLGRMINGETAVEAAVAAAAMASACIETAGPAALIAP